MDLSPDALPKPDEQDTESHPPSATPDLVDSESAAAMGYPAESANPSVSKHSSSTFDDLEKGPIAPVLVQQQHEFGPNDFEKVDALSTRRGHASTVSNCSTWRISMPPDETPPLPHKRDRRIWRRLRHNLLTVYQRLFSIVFVANMVAFVVWLAKHRHSHPFGPSLSSIATAASANILGAILIRQENVINTLYDICCLIPPWWPLRIRRTVAKLYHFGGVHSGCACAAVAWFILFTALLTKDFVAGDFHEPAVISITYTLLTLFLSICLFAIPKFRIFSHNSFEAVHRFAGWTAVALFWVEILLVLNAQAQASGAESLGVLVVKAPSFWLLLVITFFIVLPWIRLRKVDAFPEVLSNHAVRIRFKYREMGPVLAIRITHHPLKEWHAFATIPGPDGSFSLIVSDAGDWTKRQILHPANQYWIRGVPITGVLRMAEIFHKVVIVTTGSGIGPCLSMLVSHPLPCRILWSTPNPLQTYGDSIMEAVAQADPDAMILNTRASGRPDMVALAYHLYLESHAEAVFVISNPSLTRKVVYGMESRGIPAYGPIWDS